MLAGRLSAQTVAPPLLQLTAGQMRYTLGATRLDPVVALRLVSPIVPLGRRHWLVEPSASYAWYRDDAGVRHHLIVGEAGVQFQAGPRGIQPYVGAAGGLGFTKVDTVTTTDFTGSVAGGIRIVLPGGWGIAGEIRIRWLDLFARRTRELTASLFRVLE